MKLKITLSTILLITSFLHVALLPTQVVYAADFTINGKDIEDRGGIDPGKKSDNVVADILNGVYQIAAIIAVLMIVLSGVRYIISDGDPGRIQSARKGIIYALVGLVIIGSAFIITGVITGLFS